MSTLDFSDDTVAVSDIAERIEELRAEVEQIEDAEDFDALLARQENAETYDELASLEALMGYLRGGGGDEQWNGDWYPATLIADSHFTDYVKMLVDFGAILADLPSWVAIDWEETASAVQQDYSSIDFDGNTFWYR